MAGAEIAAGIDAWSLATETFADNFKSARVWNQRLKPDSRPCKELREQSIDILLASPECTHHSPARGSRPRSEDSKATASFVLNFARVLRPRAVVIENVIQMRSWSGYPDLLGGLRGLGFKLSVQTLEASDFGVPQSRKRLFVLGHLDREPVEVLARTKRHRIAEQIIDWTQRWPSSPLYTERRASATIERAERGIQALGRGVPFLIVYYGSDGGGGWQRLDRPLRTLTTLDRFGLVTWNGSEPMLRMLQVDELKQAMGFPGSYRLGRGTRRDQIKLLGNGVCPPVMHAIVSQLRE